VRRLVFGFVTLSCLGAVLAGAAVGAFLWQLQRTPREWAPYLQRRAEEHRPLIVQSAGLVARWLLYADRLPPAEPLRLPASLGASVERSGDTPVARLRQVSSLQAMVEAIAAAKPGDVIEVQPGRYQFEGYAIHVNQPGTAEAPITLRAALLDTVTIESNAVQIFDVSAPFWRFENLNLRGVCGDHTYCEHAFHIVGGATDVLIRNNRLEDFNAQIKINGEGGRFPDRGVIEGNTIVDTAPRATTNPVTPIDLVAASDWRIRKNVIADFVRGGEGQATYGGFVKGGGAHNVFERNAVICEWKLRNVPGQHVGLSLGGGGTGAGMGRQPGPVEIEQSGGIIRNNLIAMCDDDGIYLNRAANSVIDHNTLLDSAGIDARFPETSASVEANIVDGVVRWRDGGSIHLADNATPFLLGLFVGLHPQRSYFNAPEKLDLTWTKEPGRLPNSDLSDDLCGRQRGTEALPGAFDDFTFCLIDR
jgi:parallel beta-helix repeat protein